MQCGMVAMLLFIFLPFQQGRTCISGCQHDGLAYPDLAQKLRLHEATPQIREECRAKDENATCKQGAPRNSLSQPFTGEFRRAEGVFGGKQTRSCRRTVLLQAAKHFHRTEAIQMSSAEHSLQSHP